MPFSCPTSGDTHPVFTPQSFPALVRGLGRCRPVVSPQENRSPPASSPPPRRSHHLWGERVGTERGRGRESVELRPPHKHHLCKWPPRASGLWKEGLLRGIGHGPASKARCLVFAVKQEERGPVRAPGGRGAGGLAGGLQLAGVGLKEQGQRARATAEEACLRSPLQHQPCQRPSGGPARGHGSSRRCLWVSEALRSAATPRGHGQPA